MNGFVMISSECRKDPGISRCFTDAEAERMRRMRMRAGRCRRRPFPSAGKGPCMIIVLSRISR